MLRILHDQMLFTVFVGRHDTCLALVHSRSGARPIAFVARNFVLRERIVADFEFTRASKACDKFHVICNEKREKLVSESQKSAKSFLIKST